MYMSIVKEKSYISRIILSQYRPKKHIGQSQFCLAGNHGMLVLYFSFNEAMVKKIEI